MKAPAFSYVRARSVTEALDSLKQHGANAKLLAGGQSLMPAMNMRLASPEVLIDISRIADLAGIRVEGDMVQIGALTTHAAIESSADIHARLPLLSDAVRHIAHPAIRNSGTFGGSIVMADPAAEWPAGGVALNACFTLQSAAGTRDVAAREFFTGPYSTVMADDELLTRITIPIPKAGTRHVFMELARRQGDYAIVGIAALVDGKGGRDALTLAFLGASSTPVLATKTSQLFVSNEVTDATLAAARGTLAEDLDPAADLYTSAETKLHLAHVLTGRALKALYS